jgi:hypothetical protein
MLTARHKQAFATVALLTKTIEAAVERHIKDDDVAETAIDELKDLIYGCRFLDDAPASPEIAAHVLGTLLALRAIADELSAELHRIPLTRDEIEAAGRSRLVPPTVE